MEEEANAVVEGVEEAGAVVKVVQEANAVVNVVEEAETVVKVWRRLKLYCISTYTQTSHLRVWGRH